jgi:hypothetical protein
MPAKALNTNSDARMLNPAVGIRKLAAHGAHLLVFAVIQNPFDPVWRDHGDVIVEEHNKVSACAGHPLIAQLAEIERLIALVDPANDNP